MRADALSPVHYLEEEVAEDGRSYEGSMQLYTIGSADHTFSNMLLKRQSDLVFFFFLNVCYNGIEFE